MNKICTFDTTTSLLDDLNYIKQMRDSNRKLENELWGKFCPTPNTDEDQADADAEERQFSSHPKREFSDTETSATISPRRFSLSSSASYINGEQLINNLAFEKNKLQIKNARKKLDKNLTYTQTYRVNKLDVGIGDGFNVPSAQKFVEADKNDKFRTEKYVGFDEHYMQDTDANKRKHKHYSPAPNRATKSPGLQLSQRGFVNDAVFERKFKVFVEKSMHTINGIRLILEQGVIPPDGEEDIARRTIRVKEFSNRFSRNYLYAVVRQMEDIGKLNSKNMNLNHKLLTAYQVVLNGLQAYHSHLPTSIGNCSSDKLKLLLKHLVELCDMHANIIKMSDENGIQDFINTIKSDAELTVQKIDDHFSALSTESVLKSNTTKLSLQHYGASKANGNKRKQKSNMEARLSMYNVSASFRRDDAWKKAVESFNKRRPNVKSRYKAAGFKHRPPVEKESQILGLPSKCKLLAAKKSSGSCLLKRAPLNSPVNVNEDNITTLIEIENNKELKSEIEEDIKPVNHEEIVVKLLQLVLDNKRKKNSEGEHNEEIDPRQDNDEQIAEILDKLRSDGNIEVLQKILEGLQKQNDEQRGQLKLNILSSQTSLDSGKEKRRKQPIITVTGEKNAKLICIKDENSLIENYDEPLPENKDEYNEKNKKKKDINHNHGKEIILKPIASGEPRKKKSGQKVNKGPKKTHKIKINRVPKSYKCLQMLQKDVALNVIQYKLDFHKYCKNDPMYRQTSDIQPWKLVGKLSDEILNLVLLGVAREIEVNDVVEQLYQSELQL